MDARIRLSLLSLLVLLAEVPAFAYSVQTHQHLSRTAARRSAALSGTALHTDVGIRRTDAFPDNEGRYRSIVELVGFGAVQEDDIPLLRMRNHFFDPQHGGRPLVIGVELGFPSPDWILEDRGPLPDKFPKMLPQDFSLSKAHEYFRQALTGTDWPTRNRNFGLMFQTLGHVIHHLQDMAQFEHVRNDQHIDRLDTSLYEVWTRSRGQALPVSGYPDIEQGTFGTARQFWQNQGRGIAEFTSGNFVSKDTNFLGGPGSFRAHSDYPLPAIAANPPIEKVSLVDLLGPAWQPLARAQVWFIGSMVSDVNRPALSRFNPRASTYSIFQQDFALRSSPLALVSLGTSLNHFNFAAAHEFVLPRAVAYSAGLIDHFFRGRLMVEALEVVGDSATLNVRNASAAGFALRGRADGESDEFSLYYDAADGRRHRLPLTGGNLAGLTVPVGGTRRLQFTWPKDLAEDVAKPFVLLFDGVIGEEKGIAAIALEPSALKGILLSPSYALSDGIGGRRLVTYDKNGWQLSPKADLIAGTVDWRGDEPGEVLTWDGPPSRYFYPQNQRTGYSNAIYRRGRVLARAPGNVQGVAIQSVGNTSWLMAGVYLSGQLKIYVRPLLEEYANDALYDAHANPDGWREIYAGAESQPFTPMFFNASGTEAQFITANGSLLGERVKLRLSAAGVTREAVSAVGSGQLLARHRRTVVPSERTLKAGGMEPQPQLGAQACAYVEACTTQRFCAGSGEVCLLSERDYATENVATVEDREEYVFERPTVLCVDYTGDTEVLCQIAYRNDIAKALDVAETDRFESRDQTTNSCPLVSTASAGNQRESYREHLQATYGSSMRVLRMGEIEIPLTGRVRESTIDSDYLRVSSSSTQASSSNLQSGRKTQVEFEWGAESRLLYADARNGIVVYETDETKRTAVSSWVPDAVRWGWTPQGPSVARELTNRELIAVVGAQRHSLWQNTASSESTSPLGALGGIGSYGVGRPACTPVDIDEHSERSDAFIDSADWRSLFHPRINEAQGYGVDREGHLAASQTLWVRQTNGSYAASGVWNFLSRGDWAPLLPTAPANASLYPIGVID